MYKIVASDLDGTLLTPDHKLAPFTQETLKRLHQQGKTFVFALAAIILMWQKCVRKLVFLHT